MKIVKNLVRHQIFLSGSNSNSNDHSQASNPEANTFRTQDHVKERLLPGKLTSKGKHGSKEITQREKEKRSFGESIGKGLK